MLFYYIIWPWSWLFLRFDYAVLTLLISHPESMPKWFWVLTDYLLATQFIFGGAAWIWLAGSTVSKLLLKLLLGRGDETMTEQGVWAGQ